MIEIYVYGLVNSVLVLILFGFKRGFEVLARFSLDALPGRQMVIDGDKQLDDNMKKEKKKLLQDKLDKAGAMEGLSRITFYFFFIEKILLTILVIFNKLWLDEPETSIFLLISISTAIHIFVCVFLWIKYRQNLHFTSQNFRLESPTATTNSSSLK